MGKMASICLSLFSAPNGHVWQGCYPIIQVWLKRAHSWPAVCSMLTANTVCLLRASRATRGACHSASTETRSLCFQYCIMCLIKFMLSTSVKLIVSLLFISKGQDGTSVFFSLSSSSSSSFFFPLINISRILSPKTTFYSALMSQNKERLTQESDLCNAKKKKMELEL